MVTQLAHNNSPTVVCNVMTSIAASYAIRCNRQRECACPHRDALARVIVAIVT